MYVHDPLTERIIGCAIAVHKALGPGLSVGLLLNFHGETLRSGVKRLAF